MAKGGLLALATAGGEAQMAAFMPLQACQVPIQVVAARRFEPISRDSARLVFSFFVFSIQGCSPAPDTAGF